MDGASRVETTLDTHLSHSRDLASTGFAADSRDCYLELTRTLNARSIMGNIIQNMFMPEDIPY